MPYAPVERRLVREELGQIPEGVDGGGCFAEGRFAGVVVCWLVSWLVSWLVRLVGCLGGWVGGHGCPLLAV